MSLSNDYRPATFDDVIGQKVVVDIVKKMCESDQLSNRNFLFTGPAGTGKAQPLYSKVLTPNGFITMGDVKVGQKIITGSGAIANVSGVYPQGIKKIYEITLQDRTKIRVAEDHLNVFYRYNQDKKCRQDYCMTTLDLIDFMQHSYYKLRMDIPSVESFGETPVLPINPYLLGVFLGDGSLTDSSSVKFGNGESDVISKVDKLLRNEWNTYLHKLPGDNVDYNIATVGYSEYKYTFMFEGIEYKSISVMQDKLISLGYPCFDGETLIRICDNTATIMLKRYPELAGKITYTVNPMFKQSGECNKFTAALNLLGVRAKSIDKHIPKEYLLASREERILLLQGLFDTDGTISKGGATSFSTSSFQLSEDFAFLVRSLGIRDTVCTKVPKYTYNGEQRIGNTSYIHHLKIPKGLQFYTSLKHTARYKDRQADPLRVIKSIEYIGEEECQCIYVDHSDHTYISDGFIPTHNTTLSRIVAKSLNGNTDNIIEVDAASHSGVDDVRELVQQAAQYPIGTKYKIIIVDECVTGDVEILTDTGFKRFDTCNGTELVAQYSDDGKIQFVRPNEWVKIPYSGDLITWKPRNWCSVSMTPNHVQPLYYTKSKKIKEKYISDVKFSVTNNLIVSGSGVGNKSKLSAIDRLVIASQADGTIQNISSGYVHWSIQLSKQRKIDRLIAICKDGNITLSEISSSKSGCRRFTYDLPLTSSKRLDTYFNLSDFSYSYARDFIEELVQWDGYISDKYVQYISTIKDNCDFVSAVGCLGGYSARQRVQVDNRKSTYKDCYKVFLYDQTTTSCQRIKNTVSHSQYEGSVYCVKVPSHKIVVRSGGFVFITGNCHSLSNTAWQSLLKGLEEQLGNTVFIFCTTNPEKIPATIISRVQTFKLSKISTENIQKRLKYILDTEISKGRSITYTDDALSYIARLSNGGLRDAITLLDKSLAFGNDVTSELLEKALDLPSYEDYFTLLRALVKKDNASIVGTIDTVYNSGTNFVKWFEGFHSFLCNIVKYVMLKDSSRTMIPAHYQAQLNNYGVQHVYICLRLANVVMAMNKELKFTQYLQETAMTYLCSADAPKQTGGK